MARRLAKFPSFDGKMFSDTPEAAQGWKPRRDLGLAPALLRINKASYQHYSGILYGKNSFVFDEHVFGMLPIEFAEHVGPRGASAVRNIAFHNLPCAETVALIKDRADLVKNENNRDLMHELDRREQTATFLFHTRKWETAHGAFPGIQSVDFKIRSFEERASGRQGFPETRWGLWSQAFPEITNIRFEDLPGYERISFVLGPNTTPHDRLKRYKHDSRVPTVNSATQEDHVILNRLRLPECPDIKSIRRIDVRVDAQTGLMTEAKPVDLNFSNMIPFPRRHLQTKLGNPLFSPHIRWINPRSEDLALLGIAPGNLLDKVKIMERYEETRRKDTVSDAAFFRRLEATLDVGLEELMVNYFVPSERLRAAAWKLFDVLSLTEEAAETLKKSAQLAKEMLIGVGHLYLQD